MNRDFKPPESGLIQASISEETVPDCLGSLLLLFQTSQIFFVDRLRLEFVLRLKFDFSIQEKFISTWKANDACKS